ncbi:MAG: bifunctional hydroxymethylpyrimidine kinase/phosphomethylpyrimidine kinase [Pseudomonadota bacterium]
MIPNVLSIAGSDPSGGAGIQADLKAISANRAFAMAALTALTAQNTQGVSGVELVPAAFVASQITAVLEDIRVDAIKIGMIATSGIASAVADALPANVPVVLDPVMIAKGGASLLAEDAIDTLRTRLLPLAAIVTPNLPEAAHLLGRPVATNRDAMAEHAQAMLAFGPKAVLVKGGHLAGDDSPDVLCTGETLHWLDTPRTATKNTHGTGCTLSAALAAHLAHGAPLPDAVQAAKTYTSGAIADADRLSVGQGHGPVHHFSTLWKGTK